MSYLQCVLSGIGLVVLVLVVVFIPWAYILVALGILGILLIVALTTWILARLLLNTRLNFTQWCRSILFLFS